MIRYRQPATATSASPAIELESKPRPGAGVVKRRTVSIRKPRSDRSSLWFSANTVIRVRSSYTYLWRIYLQLFFLLSSLWVGWWFIRYVDTAVTTTTGPLPYRPMGVEAYLPIGGLMGALDWLYQSVLNPVHPAATILFLLFVGTSLLFRKAFCGWICPVGLLSEWLSRAGLLLFKRRVQFPRWLDMVLRGIKYFLLGFFLFAILKMSPAALHAFLVGPYNQAADIKMLEFFRHLSMTGAIVIAVLAAGSVVINGFWCRYMCPYGALMGLFSWFSPTKIHRDADLCTDCGKCDLSCPARLNVSTAKTINKTECIGCQDCIASCPVKGALSMKSAGLRLSPRALAFLTVGLIASGITVAQVTGHWRSEVSDEQVRYHVRHLDSEEYGHPGR